MRSNPLFRLLAIVSSSVVLVACNESLTPRDIAKLSGDPSNKPILLAQLKPNSDSSIDTQDAAVKGLVALNARDAAPLIESIVEIYSQYQDFDNGTGNYFQDPEERLTRDAINALETWNPAQETPVLVNLIRRSDSYDFALIAIDALEHAGKKDALQQLALDPNSYYRRQAINALEDLSSSRKARSVQPVG